MFDPSREEVRKFFMGAWQGQRSGRLLSPLEALAAEVIQHHPEFHPLLESDSEETLARTWGPEDGGMNPFLHLSLHLALEEQLGIDHPSGISAIFQRLCQTTRDEHEARHRLLECLGQILWEAQRQGTPPDQERYRQLLQATLSSS
nr:DUF1841 family protein [Ferrovum sp.]